MKRFPYASIGLAGLALVAMAAMWSGLRAWDERLEAHQKEERAHAVQLAVIRLFAALEDAESSRWGYLVTEDPDYLTPYESERQEIKASFANLARLTSDDASQQERMGDLQGAASEKLAEVEETLQRLRSGDRKGAVAIVGSGRGKSLMARSRMLVAAVNAEQMRLLNQRRSAAESASLRERRFFLAISATGMLALAAAAAMAASAARAEGRFAEDKEALRHEAMSRLAHAQRMEALGALAGGVAHDFNNILQIVLGGAVLIEKRPEDAANVRRLAFMICDAARRGASVTQRLLAFTRSAELRADSVEVLPLLAGMREMLSHTLGSGIEVKVEAPPTLEPISADQRQLETAVVNLATNARDAMAGLGTLTLSAAMKRGEEDRCPKLKPGAYVRLSVSDTGCGMTPDVLARVTEPFFTTKPAGEGVGLGLAMVRNFVEQSGGALTIESAIGRGTTAHLWLPVAEKTSAALARDSASGPSKTAAAKRARVLFVDDEAPVRALAAEELEGAGFAVVSVEGGSEALSLLDAGENVDLMISDLSMPGLDGLALLREARRRRPGLPAVILTGCATDAAALSRSEKIDAPFSILHKPIEGKQLSGCVAALLEVSGDGDKQHPSPVRGGA